MADRQNEQVRRNEGQGRQGSTPQNAENQGQQVPVQQGARGQESGLSRGVGGGLSRGTRDPFDLMTSSFGMNPFTTSPFTFMRRFMEDMDSLFQDFGMGPSHLSQGSSMQRAGQSRGASPGARLWTPQIETFERQGELVVRADLPGVSKDDVRVQLENDVLTLSGERRYEHEESRGGVFHSERSYGSFQRSVRLPQGVDPDGVRASFENGVLEVKMPSPQRKPAGRTIEVTSGRDTGTTQTTGAQGETGTQGAQGQKQGVSH